MPAFIVAICLLLAATAATVCLEECVYCNNRESENDDSYEYLTDDGESLLPYLIAHTDCLECAPEAVSKVEAESSEPYYVDDYHPTVLECKVEKLVWVLSVVTLELLELHLCPEVVEVECYDTENYNSENEHVL